MRTRGPVKQRLSKDNIKEILKYDIENNEFSFNELPLKYFIDGSRIKKEQKRTTWIKNHNNKNPFDQINNYGYRSGYILGYYYLHHRVVWLWHHGKWPKEIDHVKGKRTSNNLSSLREVSRRENRRNSAISKRNTSGCTGVSFLKKKEKWRAYITIDSKQIHLGYFKNFEEAVKARKEAEIKYGFHENHGRERTW